jgi:hypothetical protein
MKMRRLRSNGIGFMLRWCCTCWLVFLLAEGAVHAQEIPNVTCQVENYERSPGIDVKDSEFQVVVLRDPSGQQEARFDLTHGASLVSLRYRGKELLSGRNAYSVGANVSMYEVRHGTEPALKGLSPFTSAYLPNQGQSSMDVPATVAGVACHGLERMNAFAMMVDFGGDASFKRYPLMGVWKGRLSGHFPPGYSTPYTIETEANWVPNPGKTPSYYLRLEQTVVNTRADDSGEMHWVLLGAVPSSFGYQTGDPDSCTVGTPCRSSTTPAIAVGRYEDAGHSAGVAVVVPTKAWMTNQLYLVGNTDPYVGLWEAPEALQLQYLGVVLARPLAGSTGFQFQWYICAGAWNEVRDFVTELGH